MRHQLRLFLLALQFLTRVPVPAWVGYQPAWLNQCVRHFPLVGLCIGVFGALVLALALALFPPLVAVLLSMTATVWLTGAFHEDGLADTCDALGGAVSRERALEIMKDSRIGTYGACGLILALGLKAAVLTELVLLHPLHACAALVWGHAASRAAPVWLMWMLPYGGDAAYAKAKPLATQVCGRDAAMALAWLFVWPAATWLAVGRLDIDQDQWWPAAWGFALAILPIGVTTLICARWLHRRLGGYTGDTLGALVQVTELVALLAVLAHLSPALAAHE